MDVHVPAAASLRAELAEGRRKPSKWTAPTVIALLAVASILSHLILRYLLDVPRVAWQAPLILALIAGGLPLGRAADAKASCKGIRIRSPRRNLDRHVRNSRRVPCRRHRDPHALGGNGSGTICEPQGVFCSRCARKANAPVRAPEELEIPCPT